MSTEDADLACRGCGRTVYYCRCRTLPQHFPLPCRECGAPAGEPCHVIGSENPRRRNPPHGIREADEQDQRRGT